MKIIDVYGKAQERPGTRVGVVNQRLEERLEKESESRNPKIGNCPIRSPFNKQKRLSSPSQECHKIETSSQVRPFCSGATRLNYVEKFVFRRVADDEKAEHSDQVGQGLAVELTTSQQPRGQLTTSQSTVVKLTTSQ